MPYIVHRNGTAADSSVIGDVFGTYADKASAIANRPHDCTITLLVSEEEKQTWQRRESDRFYHGTYTQVPWPARFYHSTEQVTDANGYISPRYLDLRDHYAHISLDTPGMIAYTPSDVHGVEDRQVKLRAGKYLTQYAAGYLTPDEINDWTRKVVAHTSELQLATTPDDVAAVYCADNGPTSCMDGSHFNFANTPVRVYGDSDLAVAYLGTINADKPSSSQIAARAVIWPEKKKYSRTYGDTGTLVNVLKRAGYTHGSMAGAQIRAIAKGHDYVMPYVDGCEYAELDDDMFTLSEDSGDYTTQNTHGRTSERERNYCCAEDCDEEVGSDEDYCYSCNENRWSCDHCGNQYFSDDNRGSTDHGVYCDSCVSDHTTQCAACESDMCAFDWTSRERRQRNMDLCSSCEDLHKCTECDTWVDDVNTHELCDECAHIKWNRTLARPRGIVLRHESIAAYVAPAYIAPTTNGGWVKLDIVETIGALIVHRESPGDGYYHVSHKATGLRITRNGYYCQYSAVDYATQCATSYDWSFTSRDTVPAGLPGLLYESR